MKKVISGRRYDTSTATLIGSYCTDWFSRGDYNYLSEGLYRKKTGEFFLAGYGGANTAYCSSVDGARSPDVKIIPISRAEALDWVWWRLGADKYVEIFGGDEK